ncbi:hypothetical protein VNO80_10331 [Phaseolus coccineus]|uniref:Uncharacterized protein n=1 Tax=Phaseolus coccineus TaxID=3886 RepID=A0AAN9N9L2_PHACN
MKRIQEDQRNQRHSKNRTLTWMEGENNSLPYNPRHTASGEAMGMSSRQHPFTEAIMEVSLPHTWKSPTIDKYDCRIDLDDHIDAYVTQVSLYTADDTLLRRVFPTSLKVM